MFSSDRKDNFVDPFELITVGKIRVYREDVSHQTQFSAFFISFSRAINLKPVNNLMVFEVVFDTLASLVYIVKVSHLQFPNAIKFMEA